MVSKQQDTAINLMDFLSFPRKWESRFFNLLWISTDTGMMLN